MQDEAGRGGQPPRTSLSPAGPAGGRGPVWSILQRAGPGESGSGSLHRPRSAGRGAPWAGVWESCCGNPSQTHRSSSLGSYGTTWLLSSCPGPPPRPPRHQSLQISLLCATCSAIPRSDPHQLKVAARILFCSLSLLLFFLP